MESLSSEADFHDLVTSFCVGCSILITSAPNSAKNIPTDGPAKTVEISITFISENRLKYTLNYNFSQSFSYKI